MYLIVWCRISKNQFRVLHSRIRSSTVLCLSEPPPSPPSKNIDADTMCGFVLGQISRVIFIKPTLALQRMPLVKIIFDREKTLVEGQKSKKDLARNH